MAGRAQVEVIGARRLRATMKAADVDIRELKGVLAQVGSIVAAAGASRAPKLTGALGNSVRSSGTTTSAIVRAGFARVPYAGPIHWGWPARGIAANPFLSEAATETEPQWFTVYTDGVEQILDTIQGA